MLKSRPIDGFAPGGMSWLSVQDVEPKWLMGRHFAPNVGELRRVQAQWAERVLPQHRLNRSLPD